ncbi:MAG: putative deoxyribonuclease YjjV [Deltaproteobacteria bacterium ADurb.Bin207]|jgi:TatD DNase family protein|nr:MAG: putative deoxyribonuclease YjjV [Deltaproteobacteria bacterium ADurb.Bin207]
MYADVHTHLTHRAFSGEQDDVAVRAARAGLDCVIVNGLEPRSNREVLTLCARHPHLYPALGIYPVDAVAASIDRASWTYGFEPPDVFDVDEEMDFIDSVADQLVALGECGLDQYWVRDQAAEQERVLRRFCQIALAHDKPLILHSRKAEQRTLDIVLEMGITRADFHCFGGKLKLAKQIAEKGFYLSIPPVVIRSQAFQRIVQEVPLDRLLTETDAPYMGPDAGERNEPSTIPRAVAAMAELVHLPVEQVRDILRQNCRDLFGV